MVLFCRIKRALKGEIEHKLKILVIHTDLGNLILPRANEYNQTPIKTTASYVMHNLPDVYSLDTSLEDQISI